MHGTELFVTEQRGTLPLMPAHTVFTTTAGRRVFCEEMSRRHCCDSQFRYAAKHCSRRQIDYFMSPRAYAAILMRCHLCGYVSVGCCAPRQSRGGSRRDFAAASSSTARRRPLGRQTPRNGNMPTYTNERYEFVPIRADPRRMPSPTAKGMPEARRCLTIIGRVAEFCFDSEPLTAT